VTAELVLFYAFAALALFAALAMVTFVHNVVASALSLVVTMVSLAGVFVLLGAEFIGVVQIIVYAGAIMVLIVFVVMLLNLGEERYPERGRAQKWLAPILSLIFAVVLGTVLWKTEPLGLGEPPPDFGTVAVLGRELFTRYFYPFEVISLLLVAAMIGAVLLAKRRI